MEKLADVGRFLIMPWTRTLAALRKGKQGHFAKSRSGLLSLFHHFDTPGERSWRHTFGYERRPQKPKHGQPFIAREVPRSSSDS